MTALVIVGLALTAAGWILTAVGLFARISAKAAEVTLGVARTLSILGAAFITLGADAFTLRAFGVLMISAAVTMRIRLNLADGTARVYGNADLTRAEHDRDAALTALARRDGSARSFSEAMCGIGEAADRARL